VTWAEVASEALLVLLLLGGAFFFAVLVNGWPGSGDD